MTHNVTDYKGGTLGQRIRVARKEQRVSIRQLATELSVDPRTVNRWQSDDAMPSVERLMEIARVLGKPPSYFLDEEMAA